jgi:hypothetical protein
MKVKKENIPTRVIGMRRKKFEHFKQVVKSLIIDFYAWNFFIRRQHLVCQNKFTKD